MLNQLTAFGVISFLNFLSTVILGSFAFLKGRKSDVKVAYAIFAYTLAFYAFFYFLWQSSNDTTWAMALFKWTIVGVVLINTAFFNFTYTLLNMHKKYKRHLYLVHITNLFFCYCALFLFYHDWKVKYTYGLWPVPSVTFHIYLVWWFAQVICCFYLIFKKGILEAAGKQKQQCKWVLASCFIGYIGGATNWFVWYGINFPPYMNAGVALYALILGYAVLRHQLLDIEVFLRKTVIFAGIFTMAMVVVSVVSTILRGYIGRYIPISADISTLVSVLISFLFYKPTRDFFVTVTDKFLFQKKSEIKVILNRLSEQVITIVDIEQIGKTILSTLAETLRLESGMIFLQNKKPSSYRMLDHLGMTADDLAGSGRILLDDPSIINYFSNQGMAILNLDHPDKRIGLPQAVSGWLKTSKARVCIPLFINEEQFGLMVLGEKKSDQEFTQEEIDFFPTIASQASLAIRNALLIETVLEEREAKLKAEDAARRVHYAETLGHEMRNKLAMSVLTTKNLTERTVPKLKSIHEKYLAGKIADDLSTAMRTLYDQVYKSAQELKAHLDVMKIITKTAQSHLSSDAETLEEVYVKMVWEDTVKDLNMKGVNIHFVGPNDQNFIVWGNPVRLQQVFRNLIQNSVDAMRDQENKLITLECSIKEIDGKTTGYFVYTDNGPGIPAEFQNRMFDKGTSTKPKPRSGNFMDSGSGYGLYMCKDIIDIMHKGKIWYDKTYNSGAQFVFWIPIQTKAV